MTRSIWLFLAALLVSLAGIAVFVPLPIDGQEAVTLWVVEDTVPVWERAPREAAQGAWANLTQMFDRLRDEGQPPLYVMTLDITLMILGDSLVVARLFSMVMTVAAVGVIVAAARRFSPELSSMRVAVIAAMLSVYPALQVAPYGLLLLLSAWAALALVRWSESPRLLNIGGYTLALTLTMLVAHVTIPLLVLHALVAWRLKLLNFWALPVGIALMLILPLVLVFSGESVGVLATPESLQLAVIAALVVALPFVVVAVVLNTRLMQPQIVLIAVILVGLVGAAGLLLKPDWRGTINTVNATRGATDPAIVDIAARSIPGYYNRQDATVITHGISVDVGWRVFDESELDAILTALDANDSIWVMMPEDSSERAYITAQLLENRTVGFVEAQGTLVFERFDRLED